MANLVIKNVNSNNVNITLNNDNYSDYILQNYAGSFYIKSSNYDLLKANDANIVLYKPLALGESNTTTPPTNGIYVHDLRDATITPNSFGNRVVNFYFKQDVNGDWKGIMHFKGWSGSYASWQIAAQASNGFSESDALYFRTGMDDTWGSWRTLLDSNNFSNYAIPISYINKFLKVGDWWSSGSGQDVDNLVNSTAFAYSNHNAPTTGTIIDFSNSNNTNYRFQMMASYSTNYLYFRSRNGDSNTGWTPWAEVLHGGNYTNYTVTKTGSGASGTWGISISGNAATATQADSVYGRYTGNGGSQGPSYIGANTTRFNMMRKFSGLSLDPGGYMDCLMMNNYSWSDVPYATCLGLLKTTGTPRGFIACGGNSTSWSNAVELITSANIGSQNVDTVDGYHASNFSKEYTTSSYLSSTGWYKIASINKVNNGDASTGAYLITIGKNYSYSDCQCNTVLFTWQYSKAGFVPIQMTKNSNSFAYIRATGTITSNVCDIEIYYTNPSSGGNTLFVTIQPIMGYVSSIGVGSVSGSSAFATLNLYNSVNASGEFGSSEPSSSTTGYGNIGSIYYKV